MGNECYVAWEQMNQFLVDAFVGYGVPQADAQICADVLLEADRRGMTSHGCNRFKPIYIDRIVNGTVKPITKIEIKKETPTTLVIDANDGMGMVASYRMMERLLEKAKKYGMAGGSIYNSSHYGIAGYWATMASNAGYIGITGTNARPSVAPTYGVENMLGTNPLTFAMPTDEEFPFCLDCATSVIQRGKIEYYAREGKDTPEGMVIAQDGNSLTDSKQILKALLDGSAALTPLGGAGDVMCGYKGYGYATVVEILSAALTGGPFLKALSGISPQGKPQMYHLSHFFFVINPEFFMGEATFRKTAGEICRALRASKKAPGNTNIYTAGEKEWITWCRLKDKGVPIGKEVQHEIVQIRNELKLPYQFPFEKSDDCKL